MNNPSIKLLFVVVLQRNAPGGNYTMKITGVYQVDEEIWVTSQVGTTGGFGITVITKIGDSVLVDFDDVLVALCLWGPCF